MLDPQYHGESFDWNSVVVIEKFICRYYPNNSTLIWEQLTQYKTRTGIFNIELAWSTVEKIDPIIWWKANFALLAPQLTQLALRILTIPCSLNAIGLHFPTSMTRKETVSLLPEYWNWYTSTVIISSDDLDKILLQLKQVLHEWMLESMAISLQIKN